MGPPLEKCRGDWHELEQDFQQLQVTMKRINPPCKPGMHVLLLFLLGVSFVSCNEWCYDKPSCGPKTWHSRGQCGGNNQSPINIETKKAAPCTHLNPIEFIGYENRLRPDILNNTGHSAEVTMQSGGGISGGGLPATYDLKSFHFHWATSKTRGSEHTINGKRYDMELHIVHTKSGLTLEEAKQDPEGLAVLAFFIKKTKKAPIMSAWKTLADLLGLIPEKGNYVELQQEFSLGGLLKTAEVSSYFRYPGSLTTPPCSKSVIWTVFPDPIEVTPTVVKKFTTSLYFTTIAEGRRMKNIFRPLQPLGKRKVLQCMGSNNY